MKRLLKLWNAIRSKESAPKWRMVPDVHGTYTLEKWDNTLGIYLSEKSGISDIASADEIIKLASRKIIYKI